MSRKHLLCSMLSLHKATTSFLILIFLCCSIPSFCQNQDSLLTKCAGAHYLRSGFHDFWWGKHYRQIWATPVQAPYFRLAEYKGGVSPLKMGGSFQTKNLRLVDAKGHEYVLRSIDKNPSNALPIKLRKTFVAKLMRDQTSVIHPYGAFIVAPLAQAAQVYHTNPKLVVIADDPELGEFRQEFANMLALLEERPDGDWKNKEAFGNPEEIISSKKAFHLLVESSISQVDAKQYLRSRLFDMWLSDWSRREDQWRWGLHKADDQTILQPIPRDRDHAFFKFNDGVLTWLVSLFKHNYQTFDSSISKGNVKGLTKASWRMDSHILSYLNQQDFIEIAHELQQNLTDEQIAKAMEVWPSQIRELSAQNFTETLRSRREDLPKAAKAFYQIINRNVLLPGTEEEDTFILKFMPNGMLMVQLYSQTDHTNSKLVQKLLFDASETQSISLYGLGGKDTFQLTGEGKNRIKIRMHGGQDEDNLIVTDDFHLSGRKPVLLDERDGNTYQEHREVLRIREHSPKANEFTGEGWLLRHRLD